jgi:hypothetical protein
MDIYFVSILLKTKIIVLWEKEMITSGNAAEIKKIAALLVYLELELTTYPQINVY